MDFFKQHFKAETLLDGQVFAIDKPLGWTSFQVVNKIRWHLKNETGLKKTVHRFETGWKLTVYYIFNPVLLSFINTGSS